MIGKTCIVRTYSAGVFLGTVESKDGKEVKLTNARRIWFWEGAASLSQLATEGTSKPKNCKFPAAVPANNKQRWRKRHQQDPECAIDGPSKTIQPGDCS